MINNKRKVELLIVQKFKIKDFISTTYLRELKYKDLKGKLTDNIPDEHNFRIDARSDVRVITSEDSIKAKEFSLLPSKAKKYFSTRYQYVDAEDIFDNPLTHKAIRKRRCIIPMTGYYAIFEGEPYFFYPTKGKFLYALAVGETWKNPDNKTFVSSVALISRPAITDLTFIADRMPIFVPENKVVEWTSKLEYEAILRLLKTDFEELLGFHKCER